MMREGDGAAAMMMKRGRWKARFEMEKVLREMERSGSGEEQDA